MAFTHALSPSDASFARKPARTSLLARFFAALMASRQRQADREIARYMHLNGGKLTDSTEREIERRFLIGGFQR